MVPKGWPLAKIKGRSWSAVTAVTGCFLALSGCGLGRPATVPPTLRSAVPLFFLGPSPASPSQVVYWDPSRGRVIADPTPVTWPGSLEYRYSPIWDGKRLLVLQDGGGRPGTAITVPGFTRLIIAPNVFSTGVMANGYYEASFLGLTVVVENWRTGQRWSGKLPGLVAMKSAAIPLLVERWGRGARVLIQYYRPVVANSKEMVGALAWAGLDRSGLHWRPLEQPANFVTILQWPGAARVSDGVLVAGAGMLGWLPQGQNRLKALFTVPALRRLGRPIDFDPSLDADSGPWVGSWRGVGLVELSNGANGRTLIVAEKSGRVIGSLEWDEGAGRLLAVSGTQRRSTVAPELGTNLVLPKTG